MRGLQKFKRKLLKRSKFIINASKWLDENEQLEGVPSDIEMEEISKEIQDCKENLSSEGSIRELFQHVCQRLTKMQKLFEDFKTREASRSNQFAF